LFAGIGNRYGYGWGAVFSALIFAMAHLMQPGAFLPIFLLGLLLAWLYMKTGSIWACIITHSVYNSLALVFMLI
ncbi:MAG: CPBP family intramembrane metalloprotease, partial [Dehalococcoidia bacterium]|nr:CPBP family intramembrane metalloprotease [Dehalococcoidia bacterium]